MRTTRMVLFALALGGGIGSAVIWLGRWQFVFAVVIVAAAATCWGFAAKRQPRPELWIPPGGSQGTLIFDFEPPRDRSGIGCGRCPDSGFFAHRCADGTIRPGALDPLTDGMPLGIYLPDPDDRSLDLPFSIGATE